MLSWAGAGSSHSGARLVIMETTLQHSQTLPLLELLSAPIYKPTKKNTRMPLVDPKQHCIYQLNF